MDTERDSRARRESAHAYPGGPMTSDLPAAAVTGSGRSAGVKECPSLRVVQNKN